jgi:hypothetical protein
LTFGRRWACGLASGGVYERTSIIVTTNLPSAKAHRRRQQQRKMPFVFPGQPFQPRFCDLHVALKAVGIENLGIMNGVERLFPVGFNVLGLLGIEWVI